MTLIKHPIDEEPCEIDQPDKTVSNRRIVKAIIAVVLFAILVGAYFWLRW